MYKIAICDDEEKIRYELEDICRDFFASECEITSFEDGESLISIMDKYKFDMIFLDIEMNEKNGIEVKNILENRHVDTYIIFVTGYLEFVREAFGRNVSSFIVKPIKKENIIEALKKVCSYKSFGEIISVYNIFDEIRCLNTKDILYICASGDYTEIVLLNDEKVLVKRTLKEWSSLLNDDMFERIHKSYIINYAHVVNISNMVNIENEIKIPVKRGKIKLYKEKLNEYIRKTMRVV